MKVKWMEWMDCPFNWIQRIQINGLLVMCGAATPTPIHFILSFLPSISQFLLFYSLFCYNILSWATNQTKREGWVPSLCWFVIGVGSSLPFAEQASQPTKERNEKWVCFGCGGAQRSWKLITNQINSPTARLHLICLIICFPSPFHFSNPIKQTSHFVCLMELKGKQLSHCGCRASLFNHK